MLISHDHRVSLLNFETYKTSTFNFVAEVVDPMKFVYAVDKEAPTPPPEDDSTGFIRVIEMTEANYAAVLSGAKDEEKTDELPKEVKIEKGPTKELKVSNKAQKSSFRHVEKKVSKPTPIESKPEPMKSPAASKENSL